MKSQIRKPSLDRTRSVKLLHDVVNELATLVKINDRASRIYFCDGLLDLIEEIRGDPGAKVTSFNSDDVASRLSAVERKAKILCADLESMSWEPGAWGVAYKFLRAAARDQELVMPAVVHSLQLLASIAAAAASDVRTRHRNDMLLRAARSKEHSAAGRPKGTRGKVRFDFFVKQLCSDAQQMGGKKLTIYKSESADTGWDGSLLKAMLLLQPHLPKHFFPTARLGGVLNRICHG